MLRKKYYINPETLRYEQVKLSSTQKARWGLLLGAGLILLAILMRWGFERFYPTPREIIYQKENKVLKEEYASLDMELRKLESRLIELQKRDDSFYRAILDLDPLPSSIRAAGTGGSERNSHLGALRDPSLVQGVSLRMEDISNRIRIQSNSLDRVYHEALDNQHFLACRPSIHPISPADPIWLTSSYGYRLDPFTKRRTAHHGIDLAGPEGLQIHCAGEGTVTVAHLDLHGYGKEVVVDHGYGYISRYAHMKEILVKPGQKVTRGQVLGTLGNTGRSTGPHLHYEIRKNNQPVNPMYFFFENLSAKEYELLAQRATRGKGAYQSVARSQK